MKPGGKFIFKWQSKFFLMESDDVINIAKASLNIISCLNTINEDLNWWRANLLCVFDECVYLMSVVCVVCVCYAGKKLKKKQLSKSKVVMCFNQSIGWPHYLASQGLQ